MNVRRVVTGRTPEGKSIFVSDAEVRPVTLDLLPGAEFHRLWGSDAPVQLPSDGSPPPIPQYFPPVGGFRFGLFTVGPDAVTLPPELDIPTAFAEIQQKLPGLAEVLERDHPGMHTTNTIDYEIVISGEVWLELDDGHEVHLKPGDTVPERDPPRVAQQVIQALRPGRDPYRRQAGFVFARLSSNR